MLPHLGSSRPVICVRSQPGATSRPACQAAMSDSRHATRRVPTRTGCGKVTVLTAMRLLVPARSMCPRRSRCFRANTQWVVRLWKRRSGGTKSSAPPPCRAAVSLLRWSNPNSSSRTCAKASGPLADRHHGALIPTAYGHPTLGLDALLPPMTTVFVLSILIGVVAGLRTFTAPTAVSWAARLGWLDLAPTHPSRSWATRSRHGS